jgi:hypothetical protein
MSPDAVTYLSAVGAVFVASVIGGIMIRALRAVAGGR